MAGKNLKIEDHTIENNVQEMEWENDLPTLHYTDIEKYWEFSGKVKYNKNSKNPPETKDYIGQIKENMSLSVPIVYGIPWSCGMVYIGEKLNGRFPQNSKNLLDTRETKRWRNYGCRI